MPSVGEQLQAAREAQKLSVEQVADFTKIRSDHVRALEEGNYSVFSAPIYIRGFVRTYASLLKLDSNRMLEQLGHELAGPAQGDQPLVPPTGIVDDAIFQFTRFFRRLILPGAVLGVIAVVAGAVYFGWFRGSKKDPLEGMGPGLYKAPPAAETLPLKSSR